MKKTIRAIKEIWKEHEGPVSWLFLVVFVGIVAIIMSFFISGVSINYGLLKIFALILFGTIIIVWIIKKDKNSKIIIKKIEEEEKMISIWKPKKHRVEKFIILVLIVILIWIVSSSYLPKSIRCSRANVMKAIEGVVYIEGDEMTGSGFWVYPDIVLTNNHVINFNNNLMVRDYSGNWYEARVVATDTVRDLALLEVDAESQKTLKWRKESIKLIEDVFALGFPNDPKNISITKGIVSAFTKDEYDDRQYVQTDSALNYGNSGGPLVDICGKVVGINTMTLWEAENIGFATRADQVEKLIAEMLEKSKTASEEEILYNYPSDQAEVVAKYYDALGQGRLEEAYDFYSLYRKYDMPFESWKEGLENTYFIRIRLVDLTDKPNVVSVNFIVTDFGEEWGEFITKEFIGEWTLVREYGLWKLKGSNIAEIGTSEIKKTINY